MLRKRNKAALLVGGSVTAVALAVSGVFAVLAINRAGAFDQFIDGDCAPLVTIAFRGSGEGKLHSGGHSNSGEPFRYGDSALVTNGWESVTLTGLFDELSRTEYQGFEADSIPVVPVGPAAADEPYGYDAIYAVLESSSLDSALTFEGSKLLLSASRGAEAATHLIHDYLARSEGCPITPKFVIVGYSQGAMAARHTAELNPESVLGVVMIGDPYQKPQGAGVRDAGAAGVGIVRWKTNEEQRARLDAYYRSVPFTSSICHGGDPICEFSPVEGLWKLASGNYGDHMDYYTDERRGEAERDALEIAKLAYQQQLLAQQARENGQRVSWSEANAAALGGFGLRSLSLSFAGTPTLFSVLSPEMIGKQLRFEFDLDGDGVFETEAPGGTVWATFEQAGEHSVAVRITDLASGEVAEQRSSVNVGPRAGGDVPLQRSQPTSASGPEAPISRPASPIVVPASSTPAPVSPASPLRPPAAPEPGPQPDPDPDPDGEPGPDPDGEPDKATLSIHEQEVHPGQYVTITGQGFAPSAQISLTSSGLEIHAQAETTSEGGFEVGVFIPMDAEAGSQTLEVQDGSGARTFSFTVAGAAT